MHTITDDLDIAKPTVVLCHHGVRWVLGPGAGRGECASAARRCGGWRGYCCACLAPRAPTPACGSLRVSPAVACGAAAARIRRSMQMSMFLLQKGFMDVANVTGGIHAYSMGVDPNVPTY
jgi:hypothetical protein